MERISRRRALTWLVAAALFLAVLSCWAAYRHDIRVARQRVASAHIPGARVIGHASGGHVWVGHHREVIAAITTFLQ